jgi:hypothetical protein
MLAVRINTIIVQFSALDSRQASLYTLVVESRSQAKPFRLHLSKQYRPKQLPLLI